MCNGLNGVCNLMLSVMCGIDGVLVLVGYGSDWCSMCLIGSFVVMVLLNWWCGVFGWMVGRLVLIVLMIV